MADFSWFRLGQRSYSPNAPRSPTPTGGGPPQGFSYLSLTNRTSLSHGSLASNSDASLLVRKQDKIWYKPSLNQMVEGLQVAIMGLLQPIPIEYNSYILHLIEGFVDAQERIHKVDIARAEAKYSLEHHLENFKAVADEWLEREHQYKTEIKRLEVLLSRTSRDGLEAVALARTNSVIDRNGPQAKQFVSRLRRLDVPGDIPHMADKYMPGPAAKVLDRANDFLVSEKMRRQDAATNATLTYSKDRLARHTMSVAQRSNNDALVAKRKTEYPIAPGDTGSQPLFSDDEFDAAHTDDEGLMGPEESTPQERQSSRRILENLLSGEASQSSGKDTSPRGKAHKRSSTAMFNQTLEGPSICSPDSRHLRGWSGMSGFSFVPGDDASRILVNSGASHETTIETPSEDHAHNEDVIELQRYGQVEENPMCSSETQTKLSQHGSVGKNPPRAMPT
ncbi:hypothetical protein F4805DRAFT_474421 [Annulohypoxylon moriforme]|nr:hypothetical protein F4805DRAFT_474421 [Annulohypoxylon moriforme]